MAKQSGIHQLRGKVGGMKYYGMKGVEGGLVQSINEGMSERVKNGAEYANTRRNNSEFGMAASTAGAAIKSLAQRWRYLLVPFATANAAKVLYASAKGVTTEKWGSRAISPELLEETYPLQMQKFVKNDVSDFGNLKAYITEADDVPSLHLDGEAVHNEKAEAAGCSGVRCIFVGGYIVPSLGGTMTDKALPAVQETEILATTDVVFGEDITASHVSPLIQQAKTESNFAAIGYVVLLPYREVAGEKIVMQEFASAIFSSMDIVA